MKRNQPKDQWTELLPAGKARSDSDKNQTTGKNKAAETKPSLFQRLFPCCAPPVVLTDDQLTRAELNKVYKLKR